MTFNLPNRILLFACLFVQNLLAQEVPIVNYAVNANGQVELEVNSTTDKYYILQARHHVDSSFNLSTAMVLGSANTTIISEPLGAYPLENYRVLEYSTTFPGDIDGDGEDDISEYGNAPVKNPLNSAGAIDVHNGLTMVGDITDFNTLSIQQEYVAWSPYLDGKEFLKFIIFEFESSSPEIYFINTNTHSLHVDFANYMGEDHLAPSVKKGQIVYHPNVMASNGILGVYGFNYSNLESLDFATVQRTQELLASSMPFLQNNLSYYINVGNEPDYFAEEDSYNASRVPVIFESDVYSGLNYWGLNQTEGYGLFRHLGPNETPGLKDIVLYDALPNSLPRVGGVITSVIQTPLSHVNLRAIQDNIPNAFIRDPLDDPAIANLLNGYVYYNAGQSSYEIREATLEEVNDWYEKIRPSENQTPPLNLDYQKIKPLDELTFYMVDGFGAKSTNVATMRKFGFIEGTVPNGFAIPFYFYQSYMEHNQFFEEIKQLMNTSDFIYDRNYRSLKLEEFREHIENGDVPDWMVVELEQMHRSFPPGTSVRCRSSTNNEDLPGFSGAGLYDSKTHKPNEGHISKTVKEVFASLWNLRAYEEREFYRVDHFKASMGVLCHPNFVDEKVNGVGVSMDPVYDTENTFYLNSQMGEELITNPSGSDRAEELLLDKLSEDKYSVIQYSSLLPADSLLMTNEQLNLLRSYLAVIHEKFKVLYKAEGNETFAMDIEFKITSDNRLAIKQARPWVSYVHDFEEGQKEGCDLHLFPNPVKDQLNVTSTKCRLTSIRIIDIQGRLVLDQKIAASASANTPVNISSLQAGAYIVAGYVDGTQVAKKKILVQ